VDFDGFMDIFLSSKCECGQDLALGVGRVARVPWMRRHVLSEMLRGKWSYGWLTPRFFASLLAPTRPLGSRSWCSGGVAHGGRYSGVAQACVTRHTRMTRLGCMDA